MWNTVKQKITFRLIIKITIALCISCYFVISLNETRNSIGVVQWVHPRCNCSKETVNGKSGIILNSTCPYADFRGPHQKVISYSFYGDTRSKYFKGVAINAKGVVAHYRGWTMRVYHNIDPGNVPVMSSLCKEVCRFPHLDDCYVGDVTDQFRNITTILGSIWRFLVMGDPSVDTFGVRDIDSPIYQREVDAVNDWLATNRTWHIMRDNPWHGATILGGMWGARNYFENVTVMRNILEEMITKAKGRYKQLDQTLLDRIVWPVAKQDVVAHDSFKCKKFKDTRPWPSRRIRDSFVGQTDDGVITNQCPLECRPKDHRDWIYC